MKDSRARDRFADEDNSKEYNFGQPKSHSSSQPLARLLKNKWSLLLSLITLIIISLVVIVYRTNNKNQGESHSQSQSRPCIREPFDPTAKKDYNFYYRLYNQWRNSICDEPTQEAFNFLNDIWAESPHKEKTMAVRERYFDEVNSLKVDVTEDSRKLLIGISAASTEFQRRHLIRTHQINPYKKFNFPYTYKFVLLRPLPQYERALKAENDTHGDIIILDRYQDSRENARLYKLYEWFAYVENNMGVYKYVAKLDTDCFLNFPEFFANYFTESTLQLDYAIIGLMIERLGKFVWPMGAFEAITWKTMLMVNRLYANVPITNEAEDLQMGWYLYDAEINWTMVPFSPDVAYDFKFGCNPSWIRDVPYNALRVHELKDEEDYVNVAVCFNSEGVNRTEVDIRRQSNFTFQR